MTLFLFFSAVGGFTLLFQTTFVHLLPSGNVVPDLILVLCVYLGLNQHSLGAVLGAFLLGYSVDLFSSAVIGIHAFTLSLVFFVVYMSSHWIWVRSPLLSAGVVFLASWIKGATLVLLSTFFLAQNSTDGFLKHVFLDSVVAGLLAPPVFYGLSRARRALEGSRITI